MFDRPSIYSSSTRGRVSNAQLKITQGPEATGVNNSTCSCYPGVRFDGFGFRPSGFPSSYYNTAGTVYYFMTCDAGCVSSVWNIPNAASSPVHNAEWHGTRSASPFSFGITCIYLHLRIQYVHQCASAAPQLHLRRSIKFIGSPQPTTGC